MTARLDQGGSQDAATRALLIMACHAVCRHQRHGSAERHGPWPCRRRWTRYARLLADCACIRAPEPAPAKLRVAAPAAPSPRARLCDARSRHDEVMHPMIKPPGGGDPSTQPSLALKGRRGDSRGERTSVSQSVSAATHPSGWARHERTKVGGFWGSHRGRASMHEVHGGAG